MWRYLHARRRDRSHGYKKNYLILILIVYNKHNKSKIKGYRNNTNTAGYKQKGINERKYIAKFVEVKRQTIMLINRLTYLK